MLIGSFFPPHNIRDLAGCYFRWSSDLLPRPGRLLIAALALLILCYSSAATAQSKRSEWWRGTFSQQGIMSWSGTIIIGFTFDPEGDYPQKVAVVTIWPELGNATVAGEGIFVSENKVKWRERSCMRGDCSKKVLGGDFEAKIDRERTKLVGSASGVLGLKGEFELGRERSLESP